MSGPLFELSLLFAQGAQPAAGGNPLLSTLVTFLPIIILFYVLMILPKQQEEKKRKRMLDAVKKNDRVLTQAGIYGTVVSVNQDAGKVVVRIDDDKGVKVEFSKAAIVQVVDPAADKEKEKSKAAEAV